MNSRIAVVVLGMHRSGTSAFTSIFKNAGFSLGGNLMPANIYNEKGYNENVRIVQINDKMLKYLNTSWDDINISDLNFEELFKIFEDKLRTIIIEEFEGSRRICFKDPRLSLLFPIWERVLLDFGYIIFPILCIRNPSEVIESLFHRDGFDYRKSAFLYMKYISQAIKNTKYHFQFIVDFNDIFNMENIDGFLEFIDEHSHVNNADTLSADLDFSLRHNKYRDQMDYFVPIELMNFYSGLKISHDTWGQEIIENIENKYREALFHWMEIKDSVIEYNINKEEGELNKLEKDNLISNYKNRLEMSDLLLEEMEMKYEAVVNQYSADLKMTRIFEKRQKEKLLEKISDLEGRGVIEYLKNSFRIFFNYSSHHRNQ